jgi:hypothetical protein
MSFPIAQRIIRLTCLLILGVVFVGRVAAAEVPTFVKETIYSPNFAAVSQVVSSLATDVVILDGGHEQGLRLGMVCNINRGFQNIGELIIIESRSDRSAGLILELVEDAAIKAGDIARVKTIPTS